MLVMLFDPRFEPPLHDTTFVLLCTCSTRISHERQQRDTKKKRSNFVLQAGHCHGLGFSKLQVEMSFLFESLYVAYTGLCMRLCYLLRQFSSSHDLQSPRWWTSSNSPSVSFPFSGLELVT